MQYEKIRVGIGQDSHRFEELKTNKPLIIGGIEFPGEIALEGNSDADIVLHAICNAISSVTCVPILGAKADVLCKKGITDSAEYVKEAIDTLQADKNPGKRNFSIRHIAISIEAKKPKILPRLDEMRERIAGLCSISPHDVGIMATTGEGLTAFGRGEGAQSFVQITFVELESL